MSDEDYELDLAGDFLAGGGSLGVQFRGETFHILPAVEINHSMLDPESEIAETSTSQTYIVFGVTFGWVSGREMKKLDEMDQKLDRIEQKLDSQQ